MAITQDDMDQAIYILYPQNQHAWPEGKFATANDLFWPDSNPDPKPKISDIKTKAEEIANAIPMEMLREERDFKLKETDWRFRSDLSPSQDWIDYCKDLRDLPEKSSPKIDENGFLTGVTWPTKPNN